MTPRLIDLTGSVFGKLTVLGLAPNRNGRKSWMCRCSCGMVAVCLGTNLKRSISTSCGCNRLKHGMSGTKAHHVWRQMIYRCENKNDRRYADYGGRGTAVCLEWHTFEKFLEDMGHPPVGGTLDRVDNNQGYCKENCKWSSRREQARNKRTNRLVTAFGRTQTITDWAIEYKMAQRTLFNRLFRANMPPEEALQAEPYAQQKRKRKVT